MPVSLVTSIIISVLKVQQTGESKENSSTASLKITFTTLHYKSEGLKMAVFWVVKSCSLVQVYRRFRGVCCFHHQDDDCLSEYTTQVERKLFINNTAHHSTDVDFKTVNYIIQNKNMT
jgi:hypothetical protein